VSAGVSADPVAGGTAAGGPAGGRGEPVLEIRGLCVDYGVGEDAVHAVVDANLTLRRGQVLGLAGESGSGKSTLAYAATRLLREPGVITDGEVLFHSRPNAQSRPDAVTGTADLLDLDEGDLQRIRWSEVSVVMQSALNALNPVATIGHQIEDVLKAHRPDLHRGGRLKRATELLEMVGITGDRLTSYPFELSGGMRQRAMIAMALALEPQVVIMDEPTTALDVVTQREILEELIRLRDELGFAALFITHDLSLLIELADEIAVMYAGRLVERAGSESLFHSPRHPYTYGLLNSFPPMHGERVAMTGIAGSPPDLRSIPSGCAFHPRCRYAFDRCTADVPQLVPLSAGPAPAGRSPREVACWLHDPQTPGVPRELGQPDPADPAPAPEAKEEGTS
jgi:peptide/nickel transport system ATP-binding protein